MINSQVHYCIFVLNVRSKGQMLLELSDSILEVMVHKIYTYNFQVKSHWRSRNRWNERVLWKPASLFCVVYIYIYIYIRVCMLICTYIISDLTSNIFDHFVSDLRHIGAIFDATGSYDLAFKIISLSFSMAAGILIFLAIRSSRRIREKRLSIEKESTETKTPRVSLVSYSTNMT